jgi:transcriptional regulator with XRE-family HTH domain
MGSTIKTERERQNLTLRNLSEMSYTSLGYISEVERGLKQASLDVLEPLCDALNYPLSELFLVVGTSLKEAGK